MKQRLKFILLLLFAGSMFLLQSCEKDLYDEPIYQEHSLLVQRKNFADMQKQPQLLYKIENVCKKKVNAQGKMIYDSIKQIYIDLDDVMYIKDSINTETYTFKILREGKEQYIENLVLTKMQGEDYKTYITQYNDNIKVAETSDTEYLKLKIEQNIGVYEVINDDLYNNLSKIDAGCLEGTYVFVSTEGNLCASGLHSYSQGAACNYWCTTGMATPGTAGYVYTLVAVPCDGGGGPSGFSTGPHSGGPVGGGVIGVGSGFGTPPDPCSFLKSLTDDPIITAGLNFLKGKIHASSEFGYEIDRNLNYDGDNVFATVFQAGSKLGVEIEYGANVIGGMHNHPENGQAIPSWGDLRWLMLCATEERYPRNDGYNINMVVVRDPANPNAPATIYGITIDNIDLLTQEVDAIWNSEKFSKYDVLNGDRLKEINKSFGAKNADVQDDKEQLEVRFLSMFRNYGISLNKQNNDTGKWEKLVLHNPYNPNSPNQANSIDTIPCPN